MMKGSNLQHSSNPIARSYGRMLESRGERAIQDAANKWDFSNDRYNNEYIKSGVSLAQKGINDIKSGLFDSFTNIGNPHSVRYQSRPNITNSGKEKDSI